MPAEWKSRLERLGSAQGRGPDEVELGSISGVFGVKGEVRLHLHNRESDLLNDGLDAVLVTADGERFEIRIHGRPGTGGRVLGRISGIDQRDWAEELVGAAIVVPHEVLPQPDDDEYYLEEIVGMSVCTGDFVHGRVVEVHTTGPVEVMELDTGAYLPSTGGHIVGIDRVTRVIEVVEGAVVEV